MLINEHLFLTVLEAGKSKIKVLTDLVCGEDLLTGSQMAVFSLCTHMAERVTDLSGVSSIETLFPFMRAPPHGLVTSQRPHCQLCGAFSELFKVL